ncbi:RAD52 motif-containing protein 1-like [Oratosquilla oratoria]|uniref:RAD52 motif-containing protein 1-like n=1 Tax=Oratosquilla oratoria TaxID=337810 RepID=UPI003F77007A
MSLEKDAELIRMVVPTGQNHMVYMPSLHFSHDLEYKLEIELEKVLSRFGALHNLHLVASKLDQEGGFYALASFYSARAARAAIRASGKIKFGEQKLRILPRLRYKMPDREYDLPPHKSTELLSYYLGWNSWTSKVVYMSKEKDEDDEDSFQYVCVVNVELPAWGLSSEGVGISKMPPLKSPRGRGDIIKASMRFSHRAAMVSALRKIILIELGNGKMLAEVDTTLYDPVHYDSAWDTPGVYVNDLEFDPEDEEEYCALDDMTEEDLDHLLATVA